MTYSDVSGHIVWVMCGGGWFANTICEVNVKDVRTSIYIYQKYSVPCSVGLEPENPIHQNTIFIHIGVIISAAI